jgi:maleate isomerase
MIEQFERAAREVASADVTAIVQIGTPAGLVDDDGTGRMLAEKLRMLTGVPVAMMMAACLDALAALGMRRIAVATPYVEEINNRLHQTLEANGFEVLCLRGLGLEKNLDINALYPTSSYRAAREVFATAPDADGVFISCAGWRTFEIIQSLEEDLGVPVVTSSSAGLWKGLSLSGVRTAVPGLGRLFACQGEIMAEHDGATGPWIPGEQGEAREKSSLISGDNRRWKEG